MNSTKAIIKTELLQWLAIAKTKNHLLACMLKMENKYSNKKENKMIVSFHFLFLFFFKGIWWNLFSSFKRQKLGIENWVIFILSFFQNKVPNYIFCIMPHLPHHWEHILNLRQSGTSVIFGIQHSKHFPYLIRTVWQKVHNRLQLKASSFCNIYLQ